MINYPLVLFEGGATQGLFFAVKDLLVSVEETDINNGIYEVFDSLGYRCLLKVVSNIDDYESYNLDRGTGLFTVLKQSHYIDNNFFLILQNNIEDINGFSYEKPLPHSELIKQITSYYKTGKTGFEINDNKIKTSFLSRVKNWIKNYK